MSGRAIAASKPSAAILGELAQGAPRIEIPDLEWPEPPPLTIKSEGDEGLAGLLFTGRYPLAVALGWHSIHVRDSRGMAIVGFPDWILIREVVIFAELKRQKDRLSAEQAETAARLMQAGAWYELWRPSDWERIGHILKHGRKP